MQTIPSLRDCSKLIALANRLADKKRVSVAQAVELIEVMLDEEEARDRRRTVAEFASAMLAIRSRRNEVIGADVFRDPAWDMMLDLLVAAHQGRQVSVSSLCYASGVPNSTALRHIEHLDQVGLVERTPDPDDHRRAYIRATPLAVERMERIVERMQEVTFGEIPKSAPPRSLPQALPYHATELMDAGKFC